MSIVVAEAAQGRLIGHLYYRCRVGKPVCTLAARVLLACEHHVDQVIRFYTVQGSTPHIRVDKDLRSLAVQWPPGSARAGADAASDPQVRNDRLSDDLLKASLCPPVH